MAGLYDETFHLFMCPGFYTHGFERMHQFKVAILIVVCLLSQQVLAFAPAMSFPMNSAADSLGQSSQISCHDGVMMKPMATLSTAPADTSSGMAAHQDADCCKNACQCFLAGYQLISTGIVALAAIPQMSSHPAFFLPDAPQPPVISLFRPPIAL